MRGQWEAFPVKAPRDIMSYVQQAACRTARQLKASVALTQIGLAFKVNHLRAFFSRTFADERQAATLVDELDAPKLEIHLG